jgi:uncharacterized protein YjiS (DUF1127 family)
VFVLSMRALQVLDFYQQILQLTLNTYTYIERKSMTTLVANTFNLFGFSSVANWFKNLDAQLTHYRQVKQTMKELQKLNDRELNDIGIARGDIWAIAHGDTSFKRAVIEENKNLKGWV